MNLKNGLLAGAFALLAVVAAVGWSRAERGTTVANPPAEGQVVGYNAAAKPAAMPASNGTYTTAPYATSPDAPSSYATSSYATSSYGTTPASAYSAPPACADSGVGYRTGDYYPNDRYVQSIHRPVVVRQYQATAPPVYATTEVREVREVRDHHHRSGKKSLAIVAGSAGTGAAIGAIAGGGKGAGIGALAGGAGGFIYDRLTHNR